MLESNLARISPVSLCVDIYAAIIAVRFIIMLVYVSQGFFQGGRGSIHPPPLGSTLPPFGIFCENESIQVFENLKS